MSAAKEFLQYAAECRDVAAVTSDADKKAAWIHMADSLLRCAELAALESREMAGSEIAVSE